jgi:cytosine/adenosine deaminase-related metal-dependent hydrolase
VSDRIKKEKITAKECVESSRWPDRRSVLKSAALLAGGVAATRFLPETAEAQVSNRSQTFLIKGGHVLSVDQSIGDLAPGDVLIERGAISAVGRNLRVPPNAQVVDASSKLVLPGFVDAHRHAWSTILRAHTVPASYMVDIVKPFLPFYRPEDTFASVLLGCVGSLNAGITTMFDFAHTMFNDDFADADLRALKETGIRAILGHTLPHLPSSPEAQDGARRVHQKYFSSNDQDQLVTFAMGVRIGLPSIVNTMGPGVGDPWQNAQHDIKLARELGVNRIHFHAISVKQLHDVGLLGPDLCFVHPGSQTDEEVRMVVDCGATVVICAAGVDPGPCQRFVQAKIPIGLGIDDGPGDPDDFLLPMKMMLRHDRVFERQRTAKDGGTPAVLSHRQILEMATMGGARAVGLDQKIGSLTPGKRADVILLDMDNMLLPFDPDPLPAVISNAQVSNISWVFVDGQVRKRDGKLVGIDQKRVRNLAQVSYDYLVRKGNIPINV